MPLKLTFVGGLTVYCFGDPAKMSDEKCRLALRVHDEVISASRLLVGGRPAYI